MSKVVDFIVSNWVSWVIEIVILSVVAFVTISEVKKTNEQTREMLTAIQQFAGERKEAVGEAIDNLAQEVGTLEIEGEVDINEVGSNLADKAKQIWTNTNKEDDDGS